ncbi:MAG: hypothetical protein LC808_44900 [Actinobacteria bacterium]|nr:hypothetical protein [Actinomycetota bacterium]
MLLLTKATKNQYTLSARCEAANASTSAHAVIHDIRSAGVALSRRATYSGTPAAHERDHHRAARRGVQL